MTPITPETGYADLCLKLAQASENEDAAEVWRLKVILSKLGRIDKALPQMECPIWGTTE